MKIDYTEPKVSYLPIFPEKVFCMSGKASIGQLSTDDLDDGDYDQIY